MYVKVSDIAKERKVDEAALIEYATAKAVKYSIIRDNSGNLIVSTWNVDDLVRDFRKQWLG